MEATQHLKEGELAILRIIKQQVGGLKKFMMYLKIWLCGIHGMGFSLFFSSSFTLNT